MDIMFAETNRMNIPITKDRKRKWKIEYITYSKELEQNERHPQGVGGKPRRKGNKRASLENLAERKTESREQERVGGRKHDAK
jgi:hypothetical protein